VEINEKDKKILRAINEVGQEQLTASMIAEKADCSVAEVCERLKDPDFKGMYREMLESTLTAETPQILHTMAEKAKQGSFKEAKLILELTGIYSEKQRVEMSGGVDINIDAFKDNEERQAFLEATLGKLGGK